MRSFFQHSRIPDDWVPLPEQTPFSVVNRVGGIVRDDMAKIKAGIKIK